MWKKLAACMAHSVDFVTFGESLFTQMHIFFLKSQVADRSER